MRTQIVTLESASFVPLPPEAAKAFGLQPGSRIAVTVNDGSIVLQPLLAGSVNEWRGIFSQPASRPSADNYDDIRALRGILASEKGMVEELKEERRQDKC